MQSAFTPRQMIKYQLVNRRLYYKRIPEWNKSKTIRKPTLRKSQVVCVDGEGSRDGSVDRSNTSNFTFPQQAKLERDLNNRVFNSLVGFTNTLKDGRVSSMNFILSNGDRSTVGKGRFLPCVTHMIPKDALNKIRSVFILYDDDFVRGFSFFDKDKKLLWEVGGAYKWIK